MNNLVNDFAKHLFTTVTGITSNKFDELGDYDKIYWEEMAMTTIKHSAMLSEFISEKYNIVR